MMTKVVDTLKKIYINVKNVISKNKIVTILFMNVTIVLVLLVMGAVQYETIDDYMIYELLSGKWGQATSYTVYINIFLSSVLVALFKMIPSINWYVIMLLSTHVVSFTVFGHIINKKYNNGMKLYLLVLVTMYIPFLVFLQYTSQAALLILVGFIYARSIIGNKGKKYKLIFPFAMILFGSLIRFGSLMFVIPYAAIVIIIDIIKKRYDKRGLITQLVFFLASLLICLVLKVVHTNIYNSNTTYKEYLEYSNVRVIIHDYLGSGYSYAYNKKVYDSVGWSPNDYMSMILFNNADDLVFNIEKMQYIIKNVKLGITPLGDVLSSQLNLFLFPYMLLLIIVMYISVKQGNKENLILLFIGVIINIAFIAMGKLNFRTCILNTIISIVFMIYNLNKLIFKNQVNKEIFCLIVILVVVMIAVTNIIQVNINKNISIATSYDKLTEYISENQDNAYVYSRIWFK